MRDKHFEDPFLKILPTIDVHGEIGETVVVPVRDFILENFSLGREKVAIIHGRNGHILKERIHEYLKTDKRVLNYYLYNFNDGITIVELKKP